MIFPIKTKQRLVFNTLLPQSALRRDCNGKGIARIKSHYIVVVVVSHKLGG